MDIRIATGNGSQKCVIRLLIHPLEQMADDEHPLVFHVIEKGLQGLDNAVFDHRIVEQSEHDVAKVVLVPDEPALFPTGDADAVQQTPEVADVVILNTVQTDPFQRTGKLGKNLV